MTTVYGGAASSDEVAQIAKDLFDRERCPVRGTIKPFQGTKIQPPTRLVKEKEVFNENEDPVFNMDSFMARYDDGAIPELEPCPDVSILEQVPTRDEIREYILDTYEVGGKVFSCQDVYASDTLNPEDITLYRVLDSMVNEGILEGDLFYGTATREASGHGTHCAYIYRRVK